MPSSCWTQKWRNALLGSPCLGRQHNGPELQHCQLAELSAVLAEGCFRFLFGSLPPPDLATQPLGQLSFVLLANLFLYLLFELVAQFPVLSYFFSERFVVPSLTTTLSGAAAAAQAQRAAVAPLTKHPGGVGVGHFTRAAERGRALPPLLQVIGARRASESMGGQRGRGTQRGRRPLPGGVHELRVAQQHPSNILMAEPLSTAAAGTAGPANQKNGIQLMRVSENGFRPAASPPEAGRGGQGRNNRGRTSNLVARAGRRAAAPTREWKGGSEQLRLCARGGGGGAARETVFNGCSTAVVAAAVAAPRVPGDPVGGAPLAVSRRRLPKPK